MSSQRVKTNGKPIEISEEEALRAIAQRQESNMRAAWGEINTILKSRKLALDATVLINSAGVQRQVVLVPG